MSAVIRNPVPSALTENDCPLVPSGEVAVHHGLTRTTVTRAQLVSRYNTVRAAMAELAPLSDEMDGFEDECRELTTLRDLLSRTRYQVGLLGRSQVGKSTAVNRLLGFDGDDDQDAPGTSGRAGKATTSAVMRLRAGGGDAIEVVFLSPNDYDGKVAALAKLLKLDANASENELLDAVTRRLRQSESGEDIVAKPEQHEYLAKLLQSRRDHGHLLGSLQSVSYKQRSDFINHAVGESSARAPFTGAKSLLVDYVDVPLPDTVARRRLPETVELIDLPGLGANGADDWLTGRVLPTLDAALVFVGLSDNVTEAIITDVLESLRERWLNFRGLVYLVYTKFGKIDINHLRDVGNNKLQTIYDYIRDRRIDPGQVLFVDNRPEQLQAYHRRPPVLDQDATLETAFEDALRGIESDGGIGRMQDLVFSRLPDAVAEGIAQSCAIRLEKLRERMLSRIDSAMAGLSRDHQAALDRLSIRLRELAIRLRAYDLARPESHPILNQIAPVHQALMNEHHKHRIPRPVIDAGSLEEQRERLSRYFDYLDGYLRDTILPRLFHVSYERIEREIRDPQNDRPITADSPTHELLGQWPQWRDDDLKQLQQGLDRPSPSHAPSHAASARSSGPEMTFRRLEEDHPLAVLETPLSGRTFEEIVLHKLRLVARDVVWHVQQRIEARLEELQRDVRLFARQSATSIASSMGERLEPLRDQLRPW